MNTSKLNDWVSILANIGVLIGIVFLIVEIQQNTAELNAEARATRASEVIALRLWAAENPDIFESQECTFRIIGWVNAIFEIQMWQYLETGMPGYLLERYRDYRENVPCLEELWNRSSKDYDPEFVSFMNANIYN
ncbi:MAG: hypothetical protein R3F41_19085 [Gammaproteobacteria bacterium]|nr:hypothetical protein [Pseudomonadales bacterium]